MADEEQGNADRRDVMAVQAGDQAAFDGIMTRHQAGLFRFIWHMTGCRNDAEELTQETFVRAFFQIHQYRPRAPFSAWLYRIARNLCLDYFRSRAWKEQRRNDTLSDAHDIAALTPRLHSEQAEALRIAIDELPVSLREPLILTSLEGHSHEETAQKLGISAKAVEVKCFRARTALRKKLK